MNLVAGPATYFNRIEGIYRPFHLGMNMRILWQVAPSLVHGGRRERVKALGAIGVRFALGAFVIATLVPYIDPYITGDLSNSLTAAIGGAVIALVASCVKSV